MTFRTSGPGWPAVAFTVPPDVYQTISDQAAANGMPVEVMFLHAAQWYSKFLTEQDEETG